MQHYRIVDAKEAVEASQDFLRDEPAERWFTSWVMEGGPSRGTREHTLQRQAGQRWETVASWVSMD